MQDLEDPNFFDRRFWRIYLDIAVLLALVTTIYFSRLTTLPVAGEESRWARGATQMLETGDWIVPRQQQQIFAERPPMTSWTMAWVGLVRGRVDEVAVRLPSVVAILLTTLLIYAYANALLTRLAAFCAATAYATMGQVLQIGRLGESEALFTLLVAGSLLTWHLGYLRSSRRWPTWVTGYALTALAALVKGPQAPVYFMAVSAVYLLLRRDWHWLFCWAHAAGLLVFAAVISTWQIPYCLATDWSAVTATWTGLAGDRFSLQGFFSHLLTYPIETFVCLLPWSPFLLPLIHHDFRASLRSKWPVIIYLVTAIVVTYPTVWFASGAAGRYFMPLYPCLAILIGLNLSNCVAPQGSASGKRGWNLFCLFCAVACGVSAIVMIGLSVVPSHILPAVRQPLVVTIPLSLVALATCAILYYSRHGKRGLHHPQVAILVFATFIGLIYTVLIVNIYAARWNDPRPAIQAIKNRIPSGHNLVSFGPIDHRFAYFYEESIAQMPWPLADGDISRDVTYFCMNWNPNDTAKKRRNGRGRSWSSTPGTLPVAWTQVAVVSCERTLKDRPQRKIVVGRILDSAATMKRPR